MRFLTFFALFLASLLPLSANNLVNNGTFTTDCSGWTTSNTDSNFCQDGTSSLGAGNPGGWAVLNADPALVPTMSQDVSGLVIGAQYALLFDYQSAFGCCGAPSAAGVSASIDGNTWLLTVNNTDTWQLYAGVFTYTGTSSTLTFAAQLNLTDQDVGLDNIVISQVSPITIPNPIAATTDTAGEPATCALLGLPLVLISLRRRWLRV